jgi:hypothetical protein
MTSTSEVEQSELVWIRISVEVNFAGCSVADEYVSVPRQEWDAKTEDERERWLSEMAMESLAAVASCGASVVDLEEVPEDER